MSQIFPNAVTSVSKAPALVFLISTEHTGWCEQLAQEGYSVFQVAYPSSSLASLSQAIGAAGEYIKAHGGDWAIVSYGVLQDDGMIIPNLVARAGVQRLKALSHFNPLSEESAPLLVRDCEGRYIPTVLHLASVQEKLHASLSLLTTPDSLLYELTPSDHLPIAVFTYPMVSASPPFPFSTKAPALVKAGESFSVDPYVRSAVSLSYSRTLELLRRQLGPHFDLERLWEMHTYYSDMIYFDPAETMSTMVKAPYVNHVPTLTGGIGYEDLARFYKASFPISSTDYVTPPDTEIITVSRTVGADRIIDEMILKGTHTTEIDYLLPGINPTGKTFEIALVGVVAFRGDKLTFEHIYWDQASLLVQLGLLDATSLPVAGVEVAHKVLDPFGLPSNKLLQRLVMTSAIPLQDRSRDHEQRGDFGLDAPSGLEQRVASPNSPTSLARSSSLSRRLSAATAAGTDRKDPFYATPEEDRLSYMDETFRPYADEPFKVRSTPYNDKGDESLVRNAAVYGGSNSYQDLEFAEAYDSSRAQPVAEKASPLNRFLSDGKYPLEQRIEDKKRGIGRQKYPFLVWALTITMVGVFIWELVLNSREQGTPVSFKPVVNPMLGPSQSALINLGARFPPCMKDVPEVPVTTNMACMNDTANPPDRLCTIRELCGHGEFNGGEPNQWWRFITPIFLHAGFIHIILNMLAQLTAVAQIEREMGSGGFFILYFAAGIFGNVLGGNFSLVGVPSLGASGAIFGTIAVTWVDLFAHWKYHYRPVRRLIFMTIELVIGVAMGYIPYIDNFVPEAHLGGFAMGLLVGTTFYPVISTTRRHKIIMWCFRFTAIPLAVILYVVLVRNFYTSNPYAACSGCRYLSCFPTSSNNHCQGTGLTTFTTTNTN
ncbi:hypothetical protein EW146_g7942 [Bondarzewia mesenterica]|uniref:Rhomboid-type serine protease n=1 Tax=Bondarzewia mesenterica TaxID=1095465 RepID=A0A4S4LIH9_9AGAM|nr:hypothetical protein EW146_g7942 [Bondarzewia mesenterica]